MKPSRPALPAITASLAVLLVIVGILVWLKFRSTPPSPALPLLTSSPPSSASELRGSPLRAPLEVILRGRRGIIREIAGNRVVIETTDSYASPGERLNVLIKPATSFVLITIPKRLRDDRETVIRTPSQFNALTLGDDVFAISFGDITSSSSTFSALRIEKIITP